jgi:hypothetical protein
MIGGIVNKANCYTLQSLRLIKRKFYAYGERGLYQAQDDLNGLVSLAQRVALSLNHRLVNGILMMKCQYVLFKERPLSQKITIILRISVFVAITLLAGGGFDLEGGLADSDLIFGVGFHRHWFSHSIMIGLFAEFILRFILEWFRSSFQIKLGNAISEEQIIRAIWLGLGMHLIKDSAIIIGGFKPYVGLPFKLPLLMHKSFFLLNGITATYVGLKSDTSHVY